MAKRSLKKWLESGGGAGRRVVRPTKCETCKRFSKLDPDIREFMKLRAEGAVFLPIYSNTGQKSLLSYLATKGYDLSGLSLARHIGLCLGLDPKTGKPHGA
jgi:hypothetical protein